MDSARLALTRDHAVCPVQGFCCIFRGNILAGGHSVVESCSLWLKLTLDFSLGHVCGLRDD
eukprot:1860170-Rhodomonas_salina.5